jgi:hypothetical protein
VPTPSPGRSAATTLHTMDREEAKLEATLELDPRAETIVGTITGADGVEHRFSGWMELASVIDAWRTSTDAVSDAGDATPPGRQASRRTDGRPDEPRARDR